MDDVMEGFVFVGWVERSETHHLHEFVMGFASSTHPTRSIKTPTNSINDANGWLSFSPTTSIKLSSSLHGALRNAGITT